ncbi:hypothetical protein T4A_8339 [Trichinella pseudospiralis]|uniref:Uncharacterized protein n=1 Tax=Trichinella pseudospiralis TaxID=6337 RepID=A0A0V1CAR8_TRIPS|nr:hypothetical protein T4A_8339 [Trichinella pseudospiralis]
MQGNNVLLIHVKLICSCWVFFDSLKLSSIVLVLKLCEYPISRNR